MSEVHPSFLCIANDRKNSVDCTRTRCSKRVQDSSRRQHWPCRRSHRRHHQAMFLAGFRDCRNVALTYLEQSGLQLPAEDSVIVGLENHLHQCEENLTNSSVNVTPNSCVNQLSDSESLSVVHPEHLELRVGRDLESACHPQDISFQSGFPTHDSLYATTSLSENSCTVVPDVSDSNRLTSTDSIEQTLEHCASAQETSFDSLLGSSFVGSSTGNESLLGSDDGDGSTTAVVGSPGLDSHSNQQITNPFSELTQNALELMHLAQNNPNIHRILNELFELMDEEDAECEQDLSEADDGVDMNHDDFDNEI